MKGTKEADSVLVAVYGKAGAADSYAGRFYLGGHAGRCVRVLESLVIETKPVGTELGARPN